MSIAELTQSRGYKNFMKYVYGWGASIVLVGALFLRAENLTCVHAVVHTSVGVLARTCSDDAGCGTATCDVGFVHAVEHVEWCVGVGLCFGNDSS